MKITVEEIAEKLQGTVVGDGKAAISGITNMENPGEGLITFVENPKYLKRLEETNIACLIAPKTIESSSKPLIQVEYPKLN